jgi:3-keto-L-gulonate-6-phosphate decarboxylase
MKLLISLNTGDLGRALEVAAIIEPHVSMFIIGPLLLYKYGEESVKQFRLIFPEKPLMIKAQILERPAESVALFSLAGANWISVLAGAGSETIHSATTIAREKGTKIILDLTDSCSMGQAALEAERLGVEALSVTRPTVEDARSPFTDNWHMIQGNTKLPIFIATSLTQKNIDDIISLDAEGIILGSAVITAENPLKEILAIKKLLPR